MRTSGRILQTNSAVAAHNLILNAPSLDKAVELAKACFPTMPPDVAEGLYQRKLTATFTNNGNDIQIH